MWWAKLIFTAGHDLPQDCRILVFCTDLEGGEERHLNLDVAAAKLFLDALIDVLHELGGDDYPPARVGVTVTASIVPERKAGHG